SGNRPTARGPDSLANSPLLTACESGHQGAVGAVRTLDVGREPTIQKTRRDGSALQRAPFYVVGRADALHADRFISFWPAESTRPRSRQSAEFHLLAPDTILTRHVTDRFCRYNVGDLARP